MSSFSFLRLWFKIKEFQDFLIDYLHPLFRVKKNEPEGKVVYYWLDKKWDK